MKNRMERPIAAAGDLENRAGALIDDALPEIVEAGLRVDQEFTAAGRGQGDARIPIERYKAVRRAVRSATGGLAQLIYAARGPSGLGLLRQAAHQVVARTIEHYETVRDVQVGTIDRPFLDNLRTKFQAQLRQDVQSLLEDFARGFAWGQALVPPSSARTVAVHGNDGVQPAADGSNIAGSIAGRTALDELVREIDRILASPEVVALPEAERRSLAETGDDIRDEAQRGPDPSRLRRWTERFLDRLKRSRAGVADATLKTALVEALKALGAPVPSG